MQDNGVFVELRSLPWFFPTFGTAHVGNADGGAGSVDAAYVFVDKFGLVSGRRDASGIGNQGGHGGAS